MPCLLSATFIVKNRESLCPSDELVRTGTSSALATQEHNIVQKLQLGYWNLSLLFLHAWRHVPAQAAVCPWKVLFIEVKFSLPSDLVFFGLVKPHSISHCVIVWLYLRRVTPATYRPHSGCVWFQFFCLASAYTEEKDSKDCDFFLLTFALSFV